MARPYSETITIKPAKGKYRAEWRTTRDDGTRATQTRSFATLADAAAFKMAAEAAVAALPALPPGPTRPPAPRPTAPDRLTVATPGSLTLRAFADGWLGTVVARRKASTQRSYREILATHVYPDLGAVRLRPATFGYPQVLALLARRQAAGVTWGTQKAIIRVLSSCCSEAVFHGHLTANPLRGLIKRLKDDSHDDRAAAFVDPEPNPLTAAQALAFLSWLQTGIVLGVDRPVDGPRHRGGRVASAGYPEWHPYFLGLLETGMRRGEAAALKWATVYLDRPRPIARIERSYSPSAVAAGAAGDVLPKAKRAREIELAPALVAVLRDLAQTRRAEALKAGRPASPYVFVTPRGARMLSDSATAERVFLRGMAALGLEAAGHTIHDLRDTFATLHLAQNAGRLLWVSAQLGHRQPSTTLNRYAKWIPGLTGAEQFAGLTQAPDLEREGTR